QNLDSLPGIDVRADRAMVVVPTSIHISGLRYESLDPLPVEADSLPPIPEWLLDICLKTSAKKIKQSNTGRKQSLNIKFTGDVNPVRCQQIIEQQTWRIRNLLQFGMTDKHTRHKITCDLALILKGQHSTPDEIRYILLNFSREVARLKTTESTWKEIICDVEQIIEWIFALPDNHVFDWREVDGRRKKEMSQQIFNTFPFPAHFKDIDYKRVYAVHRSHYEIYGNDYFLAYSKIEELIPDATFKNGKSRKITNRKKINQANQWLEVNGFIKKVYLSLSSSTYMSNLRKPTNWFRLLGGEEGSNS
ncbi:hypothetical protein ACFL54_04100, partial [Planctomycetota bacterium]